MLFEKRVGNGYELFNLAIALDFLKKYPDLFIQNKNGVDADFKNALYLVFLVFLRLLQKNNLFLYRFSSVSVL